MVILKKNALKLHLVKILKFWVLRKRKRIKYKRRAARILMLKPGFGTIHSRAACLEFSFQPGLQSPPSICTRRQSGIFFVNSPLAILLLYWQPVESALFSGWHGTLLLPLPLHPSPESSSARREKKLWRFEEKRKKEKVKVIFPSSPLSTNRGQMQHSLLQSLRAQDAWYKVNITITEKSKILFNESKAGILLARCPFLWYQDTLSFHLVIFLP